LTNNSSIEELEEILTLADKFLEENNTLEWTEKDVLYFLLIRKQIQLKKKIQDFEKQKQFYRRLPENERKV
jgi:hypothetical protein